MSRFDTEFETHGFPALQEELGSGCTYIAPDGRETAVASALVSDEFTAVSSGFDGRATLVRRMVDLPLADVPAPSEDGRVRVAGVLYDIIEIRHLGAGVATLTLSRRAETIKHHPDHFIDRGGGR